MTNLCAILKFGVELPSLLKQTNEGEGKESTRWIGCDLIDLHPIFNIICLVLVLCVRFFLQSMLSYFFGFISRMTALFDFSGD